MGEISLPDHLREAIQPILLDEQKRTSNNSTSNVEPENGRMQQLYCFKVKAKRKYLRLLA